MVLSLFRSFLLLVPIQLSAWRRLGIVLVQIISPSIWSLSNCQPGGDLVLPLFRSFLLLSGLYLSVSLEETSYCPFSDHFSFSLVPYLTVSLEETWYCPCSDHFSFSLVPYLTVSLEETWYCPCSDNFSFSLVPIQL